MTGRHAAPPDAAFDRQERESAGAHRADEAAPGAAVTPAAPVSAPQKQVRKKPVRKKTGKSGT